MSDQEQQLFGGIEGGATQTTMVLLDGAGSLLAEAVGPCTNHWLVGLDECLKRLNGIISDARRTANVDANTPLRCVGLSLSGGDSVEAQERIRNGMLENYPALSQDYLVCCDTVGSVVTARENGGIVIISGTGSNCELINPDGGRKRCGGWGHVMGDEGSAFWISHYCIKRMFDQADNLDPCQHDMTVVKQAMKEHFGTCDTMAMLDHLYTKFNKSFFAGICKEFAKGALEDKDPLCIEAFHSAGYLLARHVVALHPSMNQSLLADVGGLHIVCVGSVWKSWSLLKPGFLEGLSPKVGEAPIIPEITLLRLDKPASYGASFLAAKHVDYHLMMDFKANSTMFFNHRFT